MGLLKNRERTKECRYEEMVPDPDLEGLKTR